MIAAILPDALISGLTHVSWTAAFGWPLLIPLIAAVTAWWLANDDVDQEWSDRRRWAALVVAVGAVVSVGYLKSAAFPLLDQQVSVRGFVRSNNIAGVCTEKLTRDQLYGLNYYAGQPLTECSPGQRPRVVNANNRLAIE
jgi:hypothetical protein